jgi:hypothetical protein
MLICFCYITTAWQRHQCFSKVFHMFWAAFVNNKSQSFIFWLPFIHSFVIQIHESSVCLSQCWAVLALFTFCEEPSVLILTDSIPNFTYINGIGNYIQSRKSWSFPSILSIRPSIRPVIHPWMASLQPMWLRFCCTLRNSHIIQQRFFLFLAKFRQLATKKNPVRSLGRN